MSKLDFIKVNFNTVVFTLLLILSSKTIAQENKNAVLTDNLKWSERTAFTILNTYPKASQIDGTKKPKWD